MPPFGDWPATQACALTRNRTSDLLFRRLTDTQPLSHTSQGLSLVFHPHLSSFSCLFQMVCFLMIPSDLLVGSLGLTICCTITSPGELQISPLFLGSWLVSSQVYTDQCSTDARRRASCTSPECSLYTTLFLLVLCLEIASTLASLYSQLSLSYLG